MDLVNQMFQGTVWGPSLWNLFFEDARCALEVLSFVVVVFADDLNSYKPFSRDVDNDSILAELRAAQSKLHEWGRGNRVGFDASKESMHVLSRSDPIGSNFKILGVNFDCKLVMEDAAHDVSVECGWKLETMLRASFIVELSSSPCTSRMCCPSLSTVPRPFIMLRQPCLVRLTMCRLACYA